MMALQVVTDLMLLIWQHPIVSCLVLVLFTPPFFPIIRFFSPLLISTGLFILALVTMGPKVGATHPQPDGEDWELRRAAPAAKVWEDRVSYEGGDDGERMSKRRRSDGSWMDWVKNIEESGLAWVEKKLKNENWKGSFLNDQNVSILQEAFSQIKAEPSTSATVEPSKLVAANADTTLTTQESISKELVPSTIASSLPFEVEAEGAKPVGKSLEMELGEDAPNAEGSEENVPIPAPAPEPAATEQNIEHPGPHGVHHHGVDPIVIPAKTAVSLAEPSPDTELDDTPTVDLSKSKRSLFANVVRKNSVNANSSSSVESDFDSPHAEKKPLSKSGKLLAIENLGDVMEMENEAQELHGKTSMGALKPTAAEEVQDVKDQLELFILDEHKVPPSSHAGHQEEKALPNPDAKPKPASKPSSPLFKPIPAAGAGGDKKELKERNEFSTDDETSSGDEELSDSDSGSEFEIFPPVEPPKMKLHTPVKLDIQQLEKRLGTPLQQHSRKPSASGGEIAEIL